MKLFCPIFPKVTGLQTCFGDEVQLPFSCRRIYSFYRVTNAVILSFTMVAIMIVVFLDGNRNGVRLIEAVTHKIGDFLGLQDDSGSVSGAANFFLDTMSTARDAVAAFSILYSAAMIITAVVRYVYLSKVNMNFLKKIYFTK